MAVVSLPCMGYYPFGNKYFSDLVHYVRSGDFVENLVEESSDLNEYAFALGALAHYAADTMRNVKIHVDIQPSLPPVAVDEDQFKQILLNLVNNAIDAVEGAAAEKRISLKASARASRAILEVEDNGPGFRDVNRAFDPFYTTKPVGKGTGLGLSICYGIVKEHDGEIRLENVHPQGARVTVELPLDSGSRMAVTSAEDWTFSS